GRQSTVRHAPTTGVGDARSGLSPALRPRPGRQRCSRRIRRPGSQCDRSLPRPGHIVSTELIGAYRPGTTLLHRISAGPKLGLVAAWSMLVVLTKGWQAAAACLVVALLIAAWARLGLRRTLKAARGLLIMLAIVSVFQIWQRGWEVA